MKNTAKADIERVLDEMEAWSDDEEKNSLYDCRNLGTDAVRGWAIVIREYLAKGAAELSVPLCRNCRHFKDGKCYSEKIRIRRRHDGSKYFSNPTVRGLNDGCTWALEEKSEKEVAQAMSMFNHERFGGDLIEALHTWAKEDQACDLKQEMAQNGDDPDRVDDILNYWAYDQLVEFIEWLFKGVGK